MTSDQPTELLVVGCLPFENTQPGFALPLLGHPENSTLLMVQDIDEISGKIGGFKVLNETNLAVIAVASPTIAIAGRDVVYAFLDENGNAHAGTLSQLAAHLCEFTARNPHRRATNLQIVELIGTEKEKKAARTSMQQTIYGQTGANSAFDFYSGTLRSIMWNILVREAHSKEAAQRIIDTRSRLSASVQNGTLVFDLSALSHEDRATINVQNLASQISSEFELAPPNETTDLFSNNSEHQDALSVQKKADDVLRRIRSSRRQEERTAILMDAIVVDRRVGLTAVLQYKRDRAKIANWAIDRIVEQFFQRQPEQDHSNDLFKDNERERHDQDEDEKFMASLVPRLFTQQYPLTRGELLYYLARHLAKWPLINKAIEQSLNRTQSMFVENWRADIEALLNTHQLSLF